MVTDDSMSDDVFEDDTTLQPCQIRSTPSPTGYRDYKPPKATDTSQLIKHHEEDIPIHKTILLGDSGVGKTSLLVQFETGKFQSGNFSATVGIGFTRPNFFYCPLSDDEATQNVNTYSTKEKKRKRQPNNIDEFFVEIDKKQKKQHEIKSTVARLSKAGKGYSCISSGANTQASHLIKLEIFDLKKLKDIPSIEHWKHADIRVKYYTEHGPNFELIQDCVYNITKEIADIESCQQYQFNLT